jgi:ABC-type transporter Mla subunit MlaD
LSLGPPFDDSGERLQVGLGAAAAALLLFVGTFAILTAERPLGDSLRVHVMVARPGSLHTGAIVEVAGETIGEVVAIRGQPATGGPTDLAPVDIELRIQQRFQSRLRRNSTIVAVNPSILTEALLEVGPPAHGAAPSPPVTDGETLRGVDPADIDQFMRKLYLSLEAVLREGRDLRPDWQDFTGAVAATATTLDRQLPAELLLRLGLHGTQARLALERLSDSLHRADVAAAPAELQALLATTTPLIDQLLSLARQADSLQSRVHDLTVSLEPRQRQLSRAIAGLGSASRDAQQIVHDAQLLQSDYLNGRGTLGGFQRDIQLFDELKELSRILKRESWRILIKRPSPGQRNLR